MIDESSERTAFEVVGDAGPGFLASLTAVIARRGGDITSVQIMESRPSSRTYFEVELAGKATVLLDELRELPVVHQVTVVNSMQKIYGKRIIIMGGGAQVGQVAIGAISEADRHNIRGEHISVDTIPLVGEKPLEEQEMGTVDGKSARPAVTRR